MRSHVRAQAALDAILSSTQNRGKGSQRTQGGRRLVMVDEPRLHFNARMVPVGVTCTVRLYDSKTGREIRIDPTRNIVRPPMIDIRKDGVAVMDPLSAWWVVLWECVTDFPNPDGWRP